MCFGILYFNLATSDVVEEVTSMRENIKEENFFN